MIRPKTPRRKRSCCYRGERLEISTPNQTWAMDFMSDTLFDNRRYRILTVVDCHSRESLAVEPRRSFGAVHVVEALDRIVRERGKPKTIRCDNGPEFAGRVLDQWAFYNGVELDFSRPATPTDNAFIESFNASVRKELLNASWFASLADARLRMDAWRKEYNEDRPHTVTEEPDPAGVRGSCASRHQTCIDPGLETGARPGKTTWPACGMRGAQLLRRT